jgi:hypothetical protein
MDDTRPSRSWDPAPRASTRAPEPEPPARRPLVRVAARDVVDPARTSPWMRVDLLQLVAWVIGGAASVVGIVALARAGFDDLAPFDPVVEVGGLPFTRTSAVLVLLLGVALLAAATGMVAERGLRVGGALLGLLGATWVVEADGFAPYLGVTSDSGVVLAVVGAALVVASFVPPLEVARPGVRR